MGLILASVLKNYEYYNSYNGMFSWSFGFYTGLYIYFSCVVSVLLGTMRNQNVNAKLEIK